MADSSLLFFHITGKCSAFSCNLKRPSGQDRTAAERKYIAKAIRRRRRILQSRILYCIGYRKRRICKMIPQFLFFLRKMSKEKERTRLTRKVFYNSMYVENTNIGSLIIQHKENADHDQ